MSHHSVGKRVRVLNEDKETSFTAVISCVADDGAFDVLYDNRDPEEDVAVPAERILDLLPFETQADGFIEDFSQLSAETLKDRGNALFAAKDFCSATEYYRRALVALVDSGSSSGSSLSIGSQVLVLDMTSGDFHDGYVSSVDGDSVDVELDDDEERTVSADALVKLAKKPVDQVTQRAVYMNLARCALKRGLKGWAIRYASIALGVTRKVLSEEQQDREPLLIAKKSLGDCLYFRGKALVAACRPGKASRDCKELSRYDKPRAQQLDAEIQAFKSKKQKDNKKLAREIARWVDQAMTQQPQTQLGNNNDIALMDDEDDDEVIDRITSSRTSSSVSNSRKEEQEPRKDRDTIMIIVILILTVAVALVGVFLMAI